jgi:glyoxylase-like metal-dependent hydrolase (beta-lactamase superfamily II)
MRGRDTAQYVTSRRFGEATVTLIDDGILRWNPQLPISEAVRRQVMPEVEADGTLALGLHVAHIQFGDASILVDTGYDDPSPEFARAHPNFSSSPGERAGLASIGVRPEAITHVLFTHPHDDHFVAATIERGGERVPRYPNARYLLARRNWQGNPAREQPGSPLALHLGLIERLGLLDLVGDEHEVVLGVTMIAAPGESPGHTIVRVRSGREEFSFLGDLYHHACEVANPDWVSPGRDRDALVESRARLSAAAVASGATLAFSHELFPPWGRIVAADGGCRWERG